MQADQASLPHPQLPRIDVEELVHLAAVTEDLILAAADHTLVELRPGGVVHDPLFGQRRLSTEEAVGQRLACAEIAKPISLRSAVEAAVPQRSLLVADRLDPVG